VVFLIAALIITSGGCLSLYFSTQLLTATQLFVDTTLPTIADANSLHLTTLKIENYTQELSRVHRREDLERTYQNLSAMLDRLESITARISQKESNFDILTLNWLSQAIRNQAQLVFQLEAQLLVIRANEQEARRSLLQRLGGIPRLKNDTKRLKVLGEHHAVIHEFMIELLAYLNQLESITNSDDLKDLEAAYTVSHQGLAVIAQQNWPGNNDDPKYGMPKILSDVDEVFAMQRKYFHMESSIDVFVTELSYQVRQFTQLTNTYVSMVFSYFQRSAQQVIQRERNSLFLTIVLMVCSIIFLSILYWRIVVRGFADRLSLISRVIGGDPGGLKVEKLPVHGRDEIADMARAVDELLGKAEKLHNMARVDDLTQVYNRRRFFELAEKEARRVARRGSPTTLVMMDLDHFKLINDTQGHSFGDRVLVLTAKACSKAIRTIDLFARYGGEEFVLLMPETGLEEGRRAAERIRKTIEKMDLITDEGDSVRITISIGLVEAHLNEITVDQALIKADQALYRAKKLGRNRVETWDPAEIVEGEDADT
jgi:diguanylate cyclase (GGDEF)-like protein